MCVQYQPFNLSKQIYFKMSLKINTKTKKASIVVKDPNSTQFWYILNLEQKLYIAHANRIYLHLF